MTENSPLHHQVCLITGASRGLGRAMAVALAKRGARLAAAARNLDDLQETVRLIETDGGIASALTVDVTEETQVSRLVQQTLAHYGRLDVLVNNAGLMAGNLAFSDITPSLWRTILATNLYGAFLCCQAVVPQMIRQGGGVMVNITSGAAVRTGFLNIPYGVSKAGLDRLTLGLGAELERYGIACISLSPPASTTDTVRRMFPNSDVDAWAHPPELTARALCELLEHNPMRYNGQVVSVREYLAGRSAPENPVP